jgi:hypothetical protein
LLDDRVEFSGSIFAGGNRNVGPEAVPAAAV